MMLEQIVRELEKKRLAYARQREGELDARIFGPTSREGRVVGLQVPDALREELEDVQRAFGLSSYKHAVFAALRAGVEVLRAGRDE